LSTSVRFLCSACAGASLPRPRDVPRRPRRRRDEDSCDSSSWSSCDCSESSPSPEVAGACAAFTGFGGIKIGAYAAKTSSSSTFGFSGGVSKDSTKSHQYQWRVNRNPRVAFLPTLLTRQQLAQIRPCLQSAGFHFPRSFARGNAAYRCHHRHWNLHHRWHRWHRWHQPVVVRVPQKPLLLTLPQCA